MREPAVFVVDDMLCKPGKGREVLDRYRADYAPGAKARGMTLERVLVSPPLWLDDQSNRLLVTWTVPGAAAWWGMSVQSRFDPAVQAFWESLGGLLTERSRFFASEAADVAALCDV